MPERNRPSITYLNEMSFSSRKLWEDIEIHHQKGIDIDRQLSLTPRGNEIQIRVDFAGPIRLVPIGDTHLFSKYSSSEATKKTFDQLDDDHALGFVTGDFIEGMCPKISDHIGSVELRLKEQMIAASDKLRPYFYANKIICAVDGFFGHEGWSAKLAGMSAVEGMSRMMPKPDVKDPLNAEKWRYLPVLGQGGLVRLHLINGREYVIQLFHDPNSGGSDNVNRAGGLKKQRLDADDNPALEGVQVDMLIAGHQHHRAVVSKEVYYDRMENKEKSVVFVSLGTSKGIEVDNQDPFLRAQGKGPALGPGPGIIVDQMRGSRNGGAELTKENVVYGYENAGVIFDAKKLQHKVEDMLNLTERQRITSELIGKIADRVRKPVATFNYRNSERATSEKDGRAPLFRELRWEINGLKDFPVMVYLLANSRYGSTSHDANEYKSKYEDIIKQIRDNPFRYGIIGRHFIDTGVSSQYNRKSILHQMGDELGVLNQENSLFGVMMSKTLLLDGWAKDVVEMNNYYDRLKRKWMTDKEVDKGFSPGDELYYRSGLKGVPLYVHETVMKLSLGQVDYTFFLFDQLGRSGSEFNKDQGLVQSRRKEYATADIVAGGHMQLTGFSIYPPKPRVYVPTGWLSDYDSQGKGNKREVAAGGQAVILFSDRKAVFPSSNLYESTDVFNYLILNKGLTQEEKIRISRRSR